MALPGYPIRKVILYQGTTSTRFRMRGNHDISEMPCYNIRRFLWKFLTESEWDNKQKKSITTYRHYVHDDDGFLHIPAQLTDHLVEDLRRNRIPHEIVRVDPYKPKPISVQLKDDFKPRPQQVEPINFFTTVKLFEYMKAIQLGCGEGKTVIALATAAMLGGIPLFVLPPFLMKQWVERIEEFLPEAKVATIAGNESIQKIIDNDYQLDADIILASVVTLAQYAERTDVYQNFPLISTFFDKLGIGSKFVDECHLNFGRNVLIDLWLNVEHNFYLSATYTRGNKTSKKIFNYIYPESIRLTTGDKLDHIDITNARYYFTGFDIPEYATGGHRGYSQFKYEKFMLKKSHFVEKFINHVLVKLIDKYYMNIRKKDQKLLILVGLKKTAYLLESALRLIYPNESISAYLSEHGEEVLKTNDIIISTSGSMGTGKDVPGLRTLLSFISVVSEGDAKQIPGRLRALKNGDVPQFVYMTNTRVSHHERHEKIKERLYQPRCRRFNIDTV